MNFEITELIPNLNAIHPYTHRVKIAKTQDYDEVDRWMEENKVRYCPIRLTNTFYVSHGELTMLLLKWS